MSGRCNGSLPGRSLILGVGWGLGTGYDIPGNCKHQNHGAKEASESVSCTHYPCLAQGQHLRKLQHHSCPAVGYGDSMPKGSLNALVIVVGLNPSLRLSAEVKVTRGKISWWYINRKCTIRKDIPLLVRKIHAVFITLVLDWSYIYLAHT